MITNIFLDFFNRDSREIFGLFANTPRERHIRLLTEATNIAAFLCSEYCILPPGFLAECDIGREAILRRAAYVTERLIRLPLREPTLDEFWEKKRREYSPFQKEYAGLFDPKNELLLRRFSQSIITRNATVADELLRTWEAGPDTSDIWRKAIPSFSVGQVELIRETPRGIRDEGFAVTWPAILERINKFSKEDTSQLRHILQHHYFDIYLREFGLTTLTRLPFSRFTFVSGSGDLTNDYEALGAALAALDVWEIVTTMSAESLISLRSKAGYYQFRQVFDTVAGGVQSARAVGECFARSVKTSPRSFKHMTSAYASSLAPTHGFELSEGELEAIADLLGEVGPATDEMAKLKTQQAQIPTTARPRPVPVIAVCVALDSERQVLVKRWDRKGRYADHWRGKLGNVDIVLFSTDDMGRVSAAVATMQFLQDQPRPSMLVVAGIAGGFKREKVKRGDILIPKNIADLATRKIREKGITIPEFRPREFRTDERLWKYVRSGSFDKDTVKWQAKPKPDIHNGPVASLDEVVSSTKWIDTLCKAWPKLCGVEMESGGVCAAADAYDLKVAVVRGVSDLANPAKSDDAWRRRAMENVALLLEAIDFEQILAQ